MPATNLSATAKRCGLFAAMIATLLSTASPAPAQTAGTTGSAGKTPTQPTADDPSYGLPEQPASMSKNPVAMSPDAVRNEGTAPASPEAGKR